MLKVSISDMSNLEGVLRAGSFIGLGLVLVAMSWAYQRFVTRDTAPALMPKAKGRHG